MIRTRTKHHVVRAQMFFHISMFVLYLLQLLFKHFTILVLCILKANKTLIQIRDFINCAIQQQPFINCVYKLV